MKNLFPQKRDGIKIRGIRKLICIFFIKYVSSTLDFSFYSEKRIIKEKGGIPMLHQHHLFRKSLCLILTLSLLLLPAGCGEQSEKTDSSASIGTSSETDDSANSSNEGDYSLPSTADTASPQGTKSSEETEVIEDKSYQQVPDVCFHYWFHLLSCFKFPIIIPIFLNFPILQM